MVAVTASFAPAPATATITMPMKKRSGGTVCFAELSFPSFLPKQVENIKDTFARKLATRIDRLPVPVSFSDNSIMSSCVRPLLQSKTSPVVLLHGFDSSCLEWRYTYPLLEEAGFETWAVDILGWGFSDLERLPPCNVASKREHFYQLWKSHIKRPIILVGPSLGAAVAIDFVVNHPEAVEKLVLIDASVYAEGTGNLATLPRIAAYAGVYLLKSIPLRLYVNVLAFTGISFGTSLDWTNVGRLHCLYPWWEDATVDFMISGGYNVSAQIQQNTWQGSMHNISLGDLSMKFTTSQLKMYYLCVCEREREREGPDKGVPELLCGNESAFSSRRRFIGIYLVVFVFLPLHRPPLYPLLMKISYLN